MSQSPHGSQNGNGNWVVATQIFLIFSPQNWRRWTHFDEHIFQMGWFNHQPANLGCVSDRICFTDFTMIKSPWKTTKLRTRFVCRLNVALPKRENFPKGPSLARNSEEDSSGPGVGVFLSGGKKGVGEEGGKKGQKPGCCLFHYQSE